MDYSKYNWMKESEARQKRCPFQHAFTEAFCVASDCALWKGYNEGSCDDHCLHLDCLKGGCPNAKVGHKNADGTPDHVGACMMSGR